MSDDMPEQPKTAQLPAADPVQVLLLKMQRSIESGFVAVDHRLDRQESTLAKVANDGVETNTRLARVEVRVEAAERSVGELEGRIGRTSTRVREASQVDMEQDAQLAQERAAREALAAKVDKLVGIGERLEKVTSNPTVKVLAGMLATAALTWLASHGGSLLQAPPAAPPAVVYVTAPADAGADQ